MIHSGRLLLAAAAALSPFICPFMISVVSVLLAAAAAMLLAGPAGPKSGLARYLRPETPCIPGKRGEGSDRTMPVSEEESHQRLQKFSSKLHGQELCIETKLQKSSTKGFTEWMGHP